MFVSVSGDQKKLYSNFMLPEWELICKAGGVSTGFNDEKMDLSTNCVDGRNLVVRAAEGTSVAPDLPPEGRKKRPKIKKPASGQVAKPIGSVTHETGVTANSPVEEPVTVGRLKLCLKLLVFMTTAMRIATKMMVAPLSLEKPKMTTAMVTAAKRRWICSVPLSSYMLCKGRDPFGCWRRTKIVAPRCMRLRCWTMTAVWSTAAMITAAMAKTAVKTPTQRRFDCCMSGVWLHTQK